MSRRGRNWDATHRQDRAWARDLGSGPPTRRHQAALELVGNVIENGDVGLMLHNWACATYVLEHLKQFPRADSASLLEQVAALDVAILHTGNVDALAVVAGRLGYDRATHTILAKPGII